MHALVYTGTQKIDYRKEKDPTPKPGESIIKVQASGICGSDMHACLLYTSPSPRDRG